MNTIPPNGTDLPSIYSSLCAAIDDPSSTRVDEAVAVADEGERLRAVSDALCDLWREGNQRLWLVGDLINAYREAEASANGKAPTYKAIAEAVDRKGWTRGWIHRLAQTAKHFPRETRIDEWTWNDHYKRMRGELRRVKHVRAAPGEVKEAVEAGAKNSREVSAHVAKKKIEQHQKAKRERAEQQERANPLKGLVNKLHCADYRDIISQLPDGAIDLMFADPPFGRIGSYYEPQRRKRTAQKAAVGYECENHAPLPAMRVTLALFDLIDKFADDGVLVLLQEGGRTLHHLISKRARSRGWVEVCEMHAIRVHAEAGADKERPTFQLGWPSPSFLDECSGPVETKIVVYAKRYGTLPKKSQGVKRPKPFRVDQTDNRNFVFWRSPSRAAAAEVRNGKVEPGYRHVFEMPSETVELILRRFLASYTRQLVVEPFACTAPACVASMRCGWRWIGCEANPSNFERGQQRIAESRGDAPRGVAPTSCADQPSK